MRRICPDDPVELRRNDLRGWAEAVGFEEVDVRNLDEPDFWELRWTRGNRRCGTAPEAEQLISFIARSCRCRIEPGQLVAIVGGDRIAARTAACLTMQSLAHIVAHGTKRIARESEIRPARRRVRIGELWSRGVSFYEATDPRLLSRLLPQISHSYFQPRPWLLEPFFQRVQEARN